MQYLIKVVPLLWVPRTTNRIFLAASGFNCFLNPWWWFRSIPRFYQIIRRATIPEGTGNVSGAFKVGNKVYSAIYI